MAGFEVLTFPNPMEKEVVWIRCWCSIARWILHLDFTFYSFIRSFGIWSCPRGFFTPLFGIGQMRTTFFYTPQILRMKDAYKILQQRSMKGGTRGRSPHFDECFPTWVTTISMRLFITIGISSSTGGHWNQAFNVLWFKLWVKSHFGLSINWIWFGRYLIRLVTLIIHHFVHVLLSVDGFLKEPTPGLWVIIISNRAYRPKSQKVNHVNHYNA